MQLPPELSAFLPEPMDLPYEAEATPDFDAATVAEAQPISLEDAVSQLQREVKEALDYMDTTFSTFWADAQRYYDGGTDLKKIEGRSQVVHTAVANAIRGAEPSILRVLMQSTAINRYKPTNSANADIAELQTLYVNNLFWQCDGYRVLSDLIHDCLLKRLGALMWHYEESYEPQYYKLTGVMPQIVAQLLQSKDVVILNYEEKSDVIMNERGENVPVPTFDLEVTVRRTHGCIRLEYVPLSELFFDQNAVSPTNNTVIGRGRNMAVGDLVALGFSREQLDELDSYDREASSSMSWDANLRRKNSRKTLLDDEDPTTRQVFIVTVYRRFDLEGTGIPQLYKFWLGGSDHEYLKHERVSEVQMQVLNAEHVPNTMVGRSFFDILRQDQDTTTSVLRGTVDNLHSANNRRLAVHEQMVNLNDVSSTKIGHPIRFRAPGMIQEIGVQPMVSAALPLLQYLVTEGQNKVGVTAAAMGLDPDALQSTDKDAVKNTIQLSQGQIEKIARNIAEGLKRVFTGLLRLSMNHLDPKQFLEITGGMIEVDQSKFDLALNLEPKVGLGTDQHVQRVAALQMILARQEQVLAAMGPSNPFCDLSHVSNTQQDLLRENGIYNPTRYFNPVDAPTGAKIAQDMQKAVQDQAAKQIDTNAAFLEAERIKAQKEIEIERIRTLSSQREEAIKAKLRTLELALKDDLERDRLAQERMLANAQLFGQYKTKIDELALQTEQSTPRRTKVDP